MTVVLRAPRASDEAAFLAAVRRSVNLHHPWVKPPGSKAAVRRYLTRPPDPFHAAFLICQQRSDLAGVVNLSEIVLGSFQSAYLGYYAFEPFAGHGMMRAGLAKVLTHAFGKMRLHRLEANIQPANARSIGLVKALGFRLEGHSPRYLKIAGRWRDHERWAILAEEWR